MSCIGKGKEKNKGKDLKEGQQSADVDPKNLLLQMENGKISNLNRTSIIGWIATLQKPQTSDSSGKGAKPYP